MPADEVLTAALEVFRKEGYGCATLEQIAQQARVDPAHLRVNYADKSSLFSALLAAHSPLGDLESALEGVEGETAEEILRDTMRRVIKILQHDPVFLELAAMDVQMNNASFMTGMSVRLLPKATAIFGRLKATGEMRPVSDPLLIRTMIAMVMGFVLSEQAMPPVARVALKLFPQRAWIDGMTDLLLYGMLEDSAR
jgi:AcrR family transcriptional regulator